MLTRPASARGSSLPARLNAVGPTALVCSPGLVALTVALAALPALVTLCIGGRGYEVSLVLAVVVGGASLGWAVDDPAAELLASMPIGAPARAVVRIGAAALVAGAVVGVVLAAVAIGPGLPPRVTDREPEAAAAAALALAVGLVAARRGERAAGAGAVTAGVIGTAFVAGLSAKLSQLPSFTAGPLHGRWWLMALGGMTVALHAGRDPARR